MSIESCSLKLRILTLVITTADLINERATRTMSISHALAAPVTIFTTYVFIGGFVIATLRNCTSSKFLQIYALVACMSMQACLSIVVFTDLKINNIVTNNAALILNGVLPMLVILPILADLILIMFQNREQIIQHTIPGASGQVSHTDIYDT